MQIQIIDPRLNKDSFKPTTKGSASIDLYASIQSPLLLIPGQLQIIPTGIRIAIPQYWVVVITPKSSRGSEGLVLGNLTSIIDSDYRGEIYLQMWNRSNNNAISIIPLERIAQMIIAPHYEHCCIDISTDDLSQTIGFENIGK